MLENSTIGTTVGITALATDADGTDIVTYSLDDDAGGRFTINASTGVITVNGSLDREIAPQYNITVRATSTDASTTTQTYTIQLGDVDEFNTTPVIDNDAAANTVAENATIGTTVGITASASDADATTNTITYSLVDNDGGRFAVELSHRPCHSRWSPRSRDERCDTMDHGPSHLSRWFVQRRYVCNQPSGYRRVQRYRTDRYQCAANLIDENTSIGTAVGITANAFDLDATNNTITYSLTDNPDGLFTIDANTGVVTTATAINREVHGGSRSITIQAQSSDGSVASQSFNIAINDMNEFSVTAPTDNDNSTNQVNENAAIGTTVGITADAFDLDATTNAVNYSLTSNPDGLFTIDANTGVVTTAAAINRELHGAVRSITIQAQSADGSTATQSFNIAINDDNEFTVTAPTDTNAAANLIDENTSIGTAVGITANAFDLDATNNTITYSLTDNPNGLFTIDANTGVVTTATAINREVHGGSRSITIQAQSSDGSVASQSFNIAINDLNEFSVTAPTDNDNSTNQVNENAAIGTTVGITADAFDLDATTNAVTYSLTSNPDGLFTIDANTGVVTTAAAINRELHGAVRSITIQAQSADGSTATQSFNIAINDANEFTVTAPGDSDNSANQVAENVSIGTAVGIVANAVDLDSTNNTVTYALTSSAGGLFQIDSVTGVVTTAGSINFESATGHSITVQATSSDGSTASTTYTIAIINVNETPTANSDRYTTTYADALNISGAGILANDTDPDGNALSVALVNGPNSGSLTLLASGGFLYTPVVPFVGEVTFQYTVTDGQLTSAVQTVTITVTMPVAPPPDNSGGGSGSGSGNSGSSGSSNSGNSNSTTNDTTTNSPTDSTKGSVVVGPIDVFAERATSSRQMEESMQSNAENRSSSDAGAQGSGALILDTVNSGSLFMFSGKSNSLLVSANLISENHRSIARLNAEQSARLVQELANTHTTFERLEDELQSVNEVPTMQGVEIIAKTAIGSGVVVWVMHISQVIAALLAASSAWMHIDPLSVLNASKGAHSSTTDDAAENMFDAKK